jgi:hypothetical protein
MCEKRSDDDVRHKNTKNERVLIFLIMPYASIVNHRQTSFRHNVTTFTSAQLISTRYYFFIIAAINRVLLFSKLRRMIVRSRQLIGFLAICNTMLRGESFTLRVAGRPTFIYTTRPTLLRAQGDEDFWAQQKELVQEMTDVTDRSLAKEQQLKFERQRMAIVFDTAYFGFFIFCALWTLFNNPFVAFSYAFGTLLGSAYAYGLGKFVRRRLQISTRSALLFRSLITNLQNYCSCFLSCNRQICRNYWRSGN